jgi:beta-glucosidase-like glycosyl hydrolase
MWCSEHRELLTDILRGEWGFDGFILTDWYGVASTVGSNAAGVDLEMPGPGRAYGPALADAVRNGAVAETALDDQVGRLLAVYERLGLLDGDDTDESPPRPAHRNIAPPLPARRRPHPSSCSRTAASSPCRRRSAGWRSWDPMPTGRS